MGKRKSAQRQVTMVTFGGKEASLSWHAWERGLDHRVVGARWREGARDEATLFAPDTRRKNRPQSRVPAELLGRTDKGAWEHVPCRDDMHARKCVEYAAQVGGLTLDEVGQILGGVSRERVRQIESDALRKLARMVDVRKLRHMLEADADTQRKTLAWRGAC